MPFTYPFLKGHGTENDFVLLPDHDGSVHGDLASGRVAALCNRRAGIGGDGVLRVIRTAVADPSQADEAEWFMDYRNADGSLSEMCGNGIRVLGLYLATHADVDPRNALPIATRDGIKTLTFGAEGISVDMGTPKVLEDTEVRVGDRAWPAVHVDLGNPHAVAIVEDLEDAGPLTEPPSYDAAAYPDGVNVEFVVWLGAQHVSMRVFERGSGETRSCGTGACAAMVVAATRDQAERGVPYTVDVPGGSLQVTWTHDDRLVMTGPAVLVAEGLVDL